MARLHLRVAVVTFANDYMARTYVTETGLAWPLLVDHDRSLYRDYGMLAASFWDVWGPKTWLAYGRELLLKGQRLQKPADDPYQRGGDVLIDPGGIVRLHHVGPGPADRPDAAEIIACVSAARSEGGGTPP